MKRSLLAVCGGMLLAAGCVGEPKDQRLTASSGQEVQRPRRWPPSPEAAVVLRKLGHVDEAGQVLANWDDDVARLERLEKELKQVGARLGQDGKIYDHTGREVYVLEGPPQVGCRLSEEDFRRIYDDWDEKLRKLRQQYTVLVLPYYGVVA